MDITLLIGAEDIMVVITEGIIVPEAFTAITMGVGQAPITLL